MVFELYDTSADSPGKPQCKFTLPRRQNCHSSVEAYSGNSYQYNPSTFSTRPEDGILTIFVEETLSFEVRPSHMAVIVVFVSTLLRFSEYRSFVPWEEWERYAWVGHREVNDPSFEASMSSSRIIQFRSVLQKQQGVMTFEVIAFRPSLVERLLHIPDGISDDRCGGEPRRLIGRRALLDVEVEDDDDPEAMITEDNIILVTVRCLADDGFPMLTP